METAEAVAQKPPKSLEEYKQAAKAVRASKPKENLMVITLSYSMQMVLPYSQGVALLAALENAEVLSEQYQRPKTITGMDRDQVKVTVMSRSEYEQIKIANLLNVSLEEVQEHALAIT